MAASRSWSGSNFFATLMQQRRASNLYPHFLLPSVAAWIVFFVATSIVAPVRGTNYTTLQVISDGNAATDDLGRANSNINSVPIRFNDLTTVGGYQFVSYYRD